MLQASNIGSSNEVIFTLKVAADAGNAGAFQKIKADAIKTQQEIHAAVAGGGAGSAASPGGIARSGPSAADTIAMNQRLQKQPVAQMVREHNNAQKEMRKSVIDNIRESQAARLAAIRTESQGYQRQAAERAERMKATAAAEVAAQAALRGEIEKTSVAHRASSERVAEGARMAANGVVGLARSFMIMGLAGEENLEKAVRSFAAFEAIVHGGTGALNIVQGGARLAGVGMGAASATLGGAAVGAGALLYGLDKLTGVTAAHQKHADFGRYLDFTAAGEGAAGGAARNADPFSRRLANTMRERLGGGGSFRDQLEQNSYQQTAALGLRDSSTGENQLSAERAVEDSYRRRYDLLTRMRDVQRDTGEKSLEVQRRVTQQFESQLELARRKREVAGENLQDAQARYADMSIAGRARLNAIAAKRLRGEELTPRERETLRNGGLGDDARDSALESGKKAGFGNTDAFKLANARVQNADASVTAASGLVEASRQVVIQQQAELEKRLTAMFGKQLEDIANAVIRSQENQDDFATVLEQQRQRAAVQRAAGG